MAGRNRIVYKIEGHEKDGHHLDLSVFSTKIQHFNKLLTESVKELGKSKVVFRVIALSHSSPATIVCEPVGREQGASAAAFHCIKKNLNAVKEEQFYCISSNVLSSFEKLTSFAVEKNSREEIHLSVDSNDAGIVYKLDEKFREKLSKVRSSEEKIISTIDGKLEQINIHNSLNKFRIYDPHYVVECTFTNDLLERVQNSLGSFVSVSGECVYRPGETVPCKINVWKMEILPLSHTLPSLKDLYGIAPDATGGKSSEEFVRGLRGGWNKDI